MLRAGPLSQPPAGRPAGVGRERTVSRVLSPRSPGGGDHLSRTPVTRRLQRPLPEGSASRLLTPPGRRPAGAPRPRGLGERPPIWSCSGRGLPGRPVTRPPVGSYPTISPLPASPPAVSFLWHFPSGHPDWAL